MSWKEEMPDNEVTVGQDKFWDYNFKICGCTHTISVDRKTGKLFIEKDMNLER